MKKKRKWGLGDEATTLDIKTPCRIIDLDGDQVCLVALGGDPMTARRYLARLDELRSPDEGPEVGDIELTDEEKRAIATLKRLSKRWPRSLWLFAAANSLHVLRAGPDGERVTTGIGEGFDQDFVVATIEIPSDGGDW